MGLLRQRQLLCLTTQKWAKYIAYIQIISCVLLLVSTGLFIFHLNSSDSYSDQQLGSLASPVTIFMIIYCFQLVMGTILYDGVMEENAAKLLAWMISIGACFLLTICFFLFYWGTSTSNVESKELLSTVYTMSPVSSTLFCLLIVLPSITSLLFVWIVNGHRRELLQKRATGKQFMECLSNYFNLTE